MNLLDIQRKTVRAVKQAARIFRKGAATVAEKGNATNLVTDADVAIQRFLQQRLQKVLPQAGFLAEEENLQRTGNEYLWVIDPIDGTANFSRSIPNCLISVALVRNGGAVLAVCYAPNLDLLFTAIKGEGAFCNGKRIATSDKDFAHSLFCTSLTPYQKNLADICSGIMDRFAAQLATASTVVIASGTGLPISTTQTLVGAIMGVGLARGIAAINLTIVRNIIVSWVVTLPAGAFFSILFYYIFKLILFYAG